MRLILVLLKHPCSTKRNSQLYVQACCGFLHEMLSEMKFYDKREVFQGNSYTEIRKTYFLAPKFGADLYTGKYGITSWEIPYIP